MADRKGPVTFEIDAGQPHPSPAEAPPVPDAQTAQTAPPEGRAMQGAMAAMRSAPSRLFRVAVTALGGLIVLGLSVRAWDLATGLLMRNTLLGLVATGLSGIVLLSGLVLVFREWLGFARLRRLDALRARAASARAGRDLAAARAVSHELAGLYANRAEMRWARARFKARMADMPDAAALFDMAETELLRPLDEAVEAEIRVAARRVAMVTAIIPIALADLAVALISNLRMIRRIAGIYGGRTGALGNWRLTRAVIAHLVATGAVAVGEDMLGPLAGGGLLSRLSRRFGEGVVNGALTARVGVAAAEVCRPLPFFARQRPSVPELVRRALTGVFGGANG